MQDHLDARNREGGIEAGIGNAADSGSLYQWNDDTPLVAIQQPRQEGETVG
jgi:hypothetical protein